MLRRITCSVLPHIGQVQDGALREWLKFGIAIHTAGLCGRVAAA